MITKGTRIGLFYIVFFNQLDSLTQIQCFPFWSLVHELWQQADATLLNRFVYSIKGEGSTESIRA